MVNSLGIVNYPSGNVYANFRNRYGVGPEDFGVKPYTQPYPQAIIPRPIEHQIRFQETWFQKLKRFCQKG